ncbi:MAG: glycosyltransferase family 2 protein [Pseudanabaenaceae cyanobacterium bins.39]|nr:glycosyltransferase family 2 protein [Pseudanabaenaceae cyanobacterium bins.39]
MLYGLNAYWLTAVHKRSRPQPKQVSSTRNSSLDEEFQDAVVAMPSGFGRLSMSSWKGLSKLRLDRHQSTGFAIANHDLPIVTVQLPIFNERYVSRRLVDAICQLDYPRDRLQIQVLDDSTDDTQYILQETVEIYKGQGFWIEYIHRVNRTGFKAGALQAAMPLVQGNYIAIFDADFIPSPLWLKDTMRHYLESSDPKVAVVQTRWGHVNSEYSLLTKLQATGLDGHFAVEQQARSNNGYFFNFNGTAGIWNRQAIIDAGGWHADTLAEDMDLSYRAQLKGWRLIYDNDIVAPAELPVAIAAFKMQQFRWAKGGMQCAKKLLRQIWMSNFSIAAKIQATFHLTGYAAYPLMLLMILTSLPLLLSIDKSSVGAIAITQELSNSINWQNSLGSFWSTLMLSATFGPPFLYFNAQSNLYPRTWYRRWLRILLLTMLGPGLSISNSRAVIAGLFNTGANFRRTPKFAIQNKSDRWENKAYRIPLDTTAIFELVLCLYSLICAAIALDKQLYGTIPFMLLYAISYGYVGGLTVWQSWQQSRD